MLLLQSLNIQLPVYPIIALNVFAAHFVGSLSFCSQEAHGCPSLPQIFPGTKFQLIPEDFVIPEVYHLPFNTSEVYPIFIKHV